MYVHIYHTYAKDRQNNVKTWKKYIICFIARLTYYT